MVLNIIIVLMLIMFIVGLLMMVKFVFKILIFNILFSLIEDLDDFEENGVVILIFFKVFIFIVLVFI